MNLLALRAEVLNHGFDPIQYSSRITQYLNDAQNLVARRVDYYVDEATSLFSTVVGTDTYAWPADLARMRSVFDTTRRLELDYVGLRDMDRSSASNGAPMYYAIQGPFTRLYPVPDAIYPLELRYWKLPATLVNDTDTPAIPADWHHMLWVYATWMCYEGDDDAQMGQYWQQRFQSELSMFAADQKFPDSDGPHQARGMWEEKPTLGGQGGWALTGGF